MAEKVVTMVAGGVAGESVRQKRQSKASALQISMVGVTGQSKRFRKYALPTPYGTVVWFSTGFLYFRWIFDDLSLDIHRFLMIFVGFSLFFVRCSVIFNGFVDFL